jgi:ubiquinone/menaquinone biosynthesis C-methylase UbiE
MSQTPRQDSPGFDARFVTRAQGERYRDRWKSGRRAERNRRECAALSRLLAGMGRLGKVLDLPSGTGRLSGVLANHAERIILADSSTVMLDLAREQPPGIPAEYLHTEAEHVSLADQSVNLVFCHRFLPHIYDCGLRLKILAELRRVTDKYVVLSFYPPGLRSRIKWSLRSLFGRAIRANQLSSTRQFLAETAASGLKPVRESALRIFPRAAFHLFERS